MLDIIPYPAILSVASNQERTNEMTDSRRSNETYTERFESCTPDGFTSPVVIRRTIYTDNSVRFHYWGRALRWLPISRDKAAMAIANAQ